MSLIANCPGCGQNYQVGEDKAGRRFRCRECEAVVTVPEASAAGAGWDEWGDEDGFTGMPERGRAQRERSAPAVKKSKAPIFIAIMLSMVLVGGLAVGAYFLFRGGVEGVSGPRAESIAYVTEDAVFAVAGHPKQFVESKFFQSLPADARDLVTQIEEGFPAKGYKASEIEQVLFFSGLDNPQFGGGIDGKWGVVVRLNAEKNIEKSLEEFGKAENFRVSKHDHQGETFYRLKRHAGRENASVWAPDSRTIIISDDRGIREIIRGGKRGRSTPLGRRLASMPMKNDIAFAFEPDDQIRRILDQMGNVPAGGAPAGMNLNALSKIQGASGWLSASSSKGETLVELTVDFADSNSASSAAGMISLMKVLVGEQLATARRQFGRQFGDASGFDAVADVFSSINAEASGNKLIISAKNPGGLDQLITKMAEQAKRELR